MRVRFHSTKETWKLRFPTQSDTFCVTTSGLLLSTSSFLFRDNEFTASSWNNWQSWKKLSFVSSAFYTPPVRRPGVPGLPQRNQGRGNAPQLIQRCHKVPLGQRNNYMYPCTFYCQTSCLLSCSSELSWCIGQATWENPEAFWVSSVYFIFISTFARAVSSDFCIPNMWLNTLMYRITATKPREFHLLQTTTSCKFHGSGRGGPPTDTLQCLKHLLVGNL